VGNSPKLANTITTLPKVIVSRVKLIMKRLGVDLRPDRRIRAEIDVDQRFIGED
jgi:hypothetical protein